MMLEWRLKLNLEPWDFSIFNVNWDLRLWHVPEGKEFQPTHFDLMGHSLTTLTMFCLFDHLAPYVDIFGLFTSDEFEQSWLEP